MWDMESKVKRTTLNWNGFKLIQNSKKTFLTCEERFDTGTTLYYIPIVPLYQMLHDKSEKDRAITCFYLQLPVPYCQHSVLQRTRKLSVLVVRNAPRLGRRRRKPSVKNELKQAELIGNIIEQNYSTETT